MAIVIAALVACLAGSSVAAQTLSQSLHAGSERQVPGNIVVPPFYRPLVEAMLRGSPTFRRQCLRLAAESTLTVMLVIGPRAQRSALRATTHIKRTENGGLTAFVEIPPLEDLDELIAHEFEHIIEQIDGVDLAAHAALPESGVTKSRRRGGTFETVRATRTGFKVAAELRQ
jgi:hypothetical protein